MTKIRTIDDLQNALDTELGWRIHELSFLRKSAKDAPGRAQAAYVRSGVAMLYAHWEGFVKSSAGYYLDYVNRKKLSSKDASDAFVYLSLKAKIDGLISVRDSFVGIKVYREVAKSLMEGDTIAFSTSVDTGSNLNSSRFSSILAAIGVDKTKYEPYFNLVDEALLSRRNHIAHGQFLSVEIDSFLETHDETVMLMRWFKSDLENSASMQSYRASPALLTA